MFNHKKNKILMTTFKNNFSNLSQFRAINFQKIENLKFLNQIYFYIETFKMLRNARENKTSQMIFFKFLKLAKILTIKV